MRSLAISFYLLSSASLRVCESDNASAPAAASAAASANANAQLNGNAAARVNARPRIGGTTVAVGTHTVELVLHDSGHAEALVTDASDRVVSEGVKLSLVASAQGGARAEGTLEFSAPRGRFEGRCQGKGDGKLELVSGPVDIALEVAGVAASAKLSEAVIVRGPEFGGHVLVAGAHSVELLARPNGDVLAFVRDRSGAAVKGDAGLALDVKASAKGAASEDVSLKFDAPRACFFGKAKAGVELAPGPLELSLKAGADTSIGRLERMALLAEAAHGGQVVLAGELSAEIVAKGKDVSAFVFDADGKAMADAKLDVRLRVGAAAEQELALRWEPPCLCYRGSLAANLDANLQPIRISIVAGSKAFVGAAASLGALVDARARAAGKLAADAKLDANAAVAGDARANANAKLTVPEVKANVGGVASKAAANINVQAPKVTVKQSADAGTQAGGKAKASAGFHIGTK
jgi:hypothetical protein